MSTVPPDPDQDGFEFAGVPDSPDPDGAILSEPLPDDDGSPAGSGASGASGASTDPDDDGLIGDAVGGDPDDA